MFLYTKVWYIRVVAILWLVGGTVFGDTKLEERVTGASNLRRKLLSSDHFITSEEKRFRIEHKAILNACTSSSECVPSDLRDSNVSEQLVTCLSGRCLCFDCFVQLNDSCQLNVCRGFNNGTSSCTDKRKSQKQAILLSAFLSSTGAANLYIGQYILGGVQLGLLLLMMLFFCIILWSPCCLICCANDDDDDGGGYFCRYFLCTGLLLLLAVVILFAIILWWMADLIVFIANSRLDANGCPLLADI